MAWNAPLQMPEVSLYRICLYRVHGLLTAETWNSCSINPLLNLPSRIIDDLMASSESDVLNIFNIFLLLTSGSLTRFNLTSFRLQEERDLFLSLTQKNCFRSLRFLSWHSRDCRTIPLIKALISSCSKLEEFDAANFICCIVFKYCKELRVLKFSVAPLKCNFVADPVNLAALASLKNLQVFSIAHMSSKIAAKILQHCPQLLSLGHNDSLNALEKIHADSKRSCETNCTEISNCFQLKRCIWGKSIKELNYKTIDINSYKSKFPERIRIAVSLCPFVQELIIYVYHSDSIGFLKNLKCLTHLKITLSECDSDHMANFMALLKIIGPKLRYLSVNGTHPFPVDIICENCPRLETLELTRFATVSSSKPPLCNDFMKYLRVMTVDPDALLFLLSSCKNLMELFLCDATCLDDNLLSQIFARNLLKELQICDIIESSLSKRGYRIFLEKAASLQRINFAPFRLDVATIVGNIITELNLTHIRYGEMFDIPYGGFGFVPPFFQF